MPEIVNGYQTEQKTVTVANTDFDINTAIGSQATGGWLVSSLTLFNDDSNVIILFSRTISEVA